MKRIIVYILAAALLLGIVAYKQHYAKTEHEVFDTVQAQMDEDVWMPIPETAQKTDSGIAYEILQANPEGRALGENDLVSFYYHFSTSADDIYDSKDYHETPMVSVSNSIMAGMKEAVFLGKTGEKLRAWIPGALLLDGTIDASAMFVLDYEIVDIATPAIPPKSIPKNAKKLDSGAAYLITKANPKGAKLTEDDFLTLTFNAWFQKNGLLESSSKAEYASFLHNPENAGMMFHYVFNDFTPSVQDVLKQLRVGETAQIWLPQEVDLSLESGVLEASVIDIEVIDAITIPRAPKDVAAPPAGANITASGLASKVLKAGKGKRPTDDSRVEFNMTSWTTDGVLYVTTLLGDDGNVFLLSHLIEGLREGLKLMKVGETRRFWIPGHLAFEGVEGKPQGMIVYDIELLNAL